MERKQVSIWKSLYSGDLYKMPKDWMPRFGGWELQAVCFEDEIDKVIKERKL